LLCCAGVAVGAVAVLLLLVMLTSISLNMCMARTGKIRRQLNWWHKHLAGMPKSGKMAIVVTDIEGYSGALLRTCIKLHSSIYVLCGPDAMHLLWFLCTACILHTCPSAAPS
jgi:hypothetical protein